MKREFIERVKNRLVHVLEESSYIVNQKVKSTSFLIESPMNICYTK